MALTSGDYHGVVAAARAGTEIAAQHGVTVQLAAQEAKAWSRIGDRRQAEVALDRGRRLLDALPYPDNLDDHFVVDPTKFDFYAMDCYRMLAEDKLTETLADEVIRSSTDFDGSFPRTPGALYTALHCPTCEKFPYGFKGARSAPESGLGGVNQAPRDSASDPARRSPRPAAGLP